MARIAPRPSRPKAAATSGSTLAAAEVAAVCGIERDAAIDQLQDVARRIPWGNGALWELG